MKLGKPRSENKMKPFQRPPELMFAQPMAFTIGELTNRNERVALKMNRENSAFYNPMGYKLLCGFAVPSFQRGIVWTDDQCLSFIDSAWRGIGLGSYAINFSTSVKINPKLRNIIIDGQQRLNALQRYFDDELTYRDYKWSQLEKRDTRGFESIMFAQMRTNSNNEKEVRDYYNRMNFGGTTHTEAERA